MDVGRFLLEKLHEFLLLLRRFGVFLATKFNELLPPETRAETLKHWLLVGAPWAIAMVLFLMGMWCCCPSSLRSCSSCLRRACCCCRRRKMMKAPGRDYLMAREDFESDPRAYFLDLRGKALVD